MNVKLSRSLNFLLGCFVVLTTYSPQANCAPQSPAPGSPPLALNLNSKQASVTVTNGTLKNSASTSITVGGSAMTVQAGQHLTPAEFAALSQVLSGAKQSLIINNFGQAVAGTLQLNGLLSLNSGGNLSSLVVPRNVTLVDNFASGSPLNLTGNFVNYGNLFAYSSNSAVTTGVLSANNIFNNSGALISTVLPASLGLSAGTLHLTLNALNSLTNAGTISSSGNLTLAAGGAFANTGTVQAAQNLNLTSNAGQITNSGLVSALAGNVNISTLATQNLAVNNAAGTIQALQGAINFRDASYSGSAGMSISGGNILAQSVNLNSGSGGANLDVDNFAGTLNATACNLVTYAPSPDLVLGDINVSGDPVIVNPTNSVTVSANLGPGAILIAAKGDVTSLPSVKTISSGGQGDITIVAGAVISQLGNVISVGGASTTGGSINIQNVTVSTNSSTGNANNINLIAYSGGLNTHTGQILMNGSTASANSTFAGGSGGNVLIVGGSANNFSQFNDHDNWTLPTISSTGMQSDPKPAGSVTIITAQPTTTDGQQVTFNATTGAQTSTNAFIASSTLSQVGAITNNTLSFSKITTNGGNLTLLSSLAILGGTVDLSHKNGTGNGGNATIYTPYFPGSNPDVSSINLTSVMTAGSAQGNSTGGNILIACGRTLSISGAVDSGASTGNSSGGNINITATTGLSFDTVDSSVPTGTSGNILIVAGVGNPTFTGTQLTFTNSAGLGSVSGNNIISQAGMGTPGNINIIAISTNPNQAGQVTVKNVSGNNVSIFGDGTGSATAVQTSGNVTGTSQVLIAAANYTNSNSGTVTIAVPSGVVSPLPFTDAGGAGNNIVLGGSVSAPSITLHSTNGQISAQALTASGGPTPATDSIVLHASTNIVLNGAVKSTGNVTLQSDTANINFNYNNITAANTVTVLASNGSITVSSVPNAPNFVVDAKLDVSNTVAVSVTGNLTLQSDTGTVTLNQDVTAGGVVTISANGQIIQPFTDGMQNSVTNVTQGSTSAVFSANGSQLLVLAGNSFSTIDPTTGKQTSTVAIPESATAIFAGFSPNGSQKFIVGNNPNANLGFLFIYNGNTLSKTINLGALAYSMVASPKSNFVYVTTQGVSGSTLFAVNTSTGAVVKQLSIPSQAALAIDPTGQNLYLVSATSVSRYQTQTNMIIGTATVTGATGISLATMDASGSILYATDNATNKIFQIDPGTLAVLGSVSLPTGPSNKIQAMSINSQGTEFYLSTPTHILVMQANTGTIDQQLLIPNTNNSSMNTGSVGVVDGRFKVFVPNLTGVQSVQLNQFSDTMINGQGVVLTSATTNLGLAVNTKGGMDSAINAPNAAIADLGAIKLGTSTVTGSLLLGSSGNLSTDGPVNAATVQLQTATSQADIDIGANATATGAMRLTTQDILSLEATASGTTQTIGAATISMTNGAITATAGAVTFNGTAGSVTTLEGTGSVTATNGIVINASSPIITIPSLNFDGTFNLQGGTPGTTMNAINGIVSFSAQSQVTSNTTTVNACLVDNPNGLIGPVTINVSPNCQLGPGCGTLTNPNGDITLSPNILVNTNGKALSVIAAGNILASGLPTIDLSSATTSGGALNLIAGFVFAPADTNLTLNTTTVFNITGTSASGGSVILGNTSINTSTTSPAPSPGVFTGAGGAVTVVAHAGNVNAGTINIASINTSSKNGTAGTVSLIGQGGVQVGNVTTNGAKSGGNVQINGSEPVASATAQVFNGNLSGGGFSAKPPANGANATITVNGTIDTSATTGSGGNVSLVSDSTIAVNGSINTNVNQGGSGSGAGSITLQSTNGNINVTGSLNASGSSDTSSTSTLNALNGGNISILPVSFAQIGGSVLANGGSTAGTGSGGKAGTVKIATGTSNPTGSSIGNVTITGSLNLAGGSSGGGSGGGGGSLTVTAGSFVVAGTGAGGFSINAGGGAGKSGTGSTGNVNITTYSIQGLPANLDTTSSTKSVVALPGGLFSVGDTMLVNGTTGSITNGRFTATSKNAGRIVGSNPFNQPGVVIKVQGGAYNLNLGGTVLGIGPDNGSGIRTMITPATALALYTVSRNPGQPAQKQTVGLNSAGQAINAAPAGGNSRTTVNAFDFPSPMTGFNLGTVDTNNSNLITLTINGTAPVDLSGVSNTTISGTLAFASSGTVLFGQLVTVGATGTLSAATTGTLNIGGKFSALTDNGKILGKSIVITPNNNSLTLNMGTAGQIGVASGTGTVSVIASVLTVSGGAITTGTTFSQTPVGNPGAVSINTAFNGTAALGNINAASLTLAAPTSSGIAIAANANVTANNMTITTSQGLTVGANANIIAGVNVAFGGGATITAAGNVSFGNGSTLEARNDVNVTSSGGSLTLGTTVVVSSIQGNISLTASSMTLQNGSVVHAGTLKGNDPGTGVVPPGNIIAAGSVTMTSTGGDITINSGTGDNSTLIGSVGANTSIYSSNNITIGNAAQFRADGGSLLIGANGKLDGGTGDSFVARSVGTSGGGIALGSVTSVKTVLPMNLAATFKATSGTAPNPTQLGTNVVINNSGGTSGAVVLNTTTSPNINLSNTGTQAVLTLQGGAMNFTAGPGSTPNEILMNGATFTTYGVVPMSYEPQAESAVRDLVVDTGDVGDDAAGESQTAMNL